MGPYYFDRTPRPRKTLEEVGEEWIQRQERRQQRLYLIFQRMTKETRAQIAISIKLVGLEKSQGIFGRDRALTVCIYHDSLKDNYTRFFG